MIRAAIHAFPLAPVVFGAVLLVSIAAVRRGADVSPRVRWARGAWVAAVGCFLAATLTPTADMSIEPWSLEYYRHLIRSMAVSLPNSHELLGLNDVSLNVLIGIPLGLTAVLLAAVSHSWWPVWSAVLLPLACEFVQALVPQLGRVAFILSGVINNEIGVAIGLALGAATAGAVRVFYGVTRARAPRSSSGAD